MASQITKIYLIANGDLRLSANQTCWPEQARMEALLVKAIKAEGWKVVRAHSYDPAKKHGFIDSQKMGMEVFRRVPPEYRSEVRSLSNRSRRHC